MWWLTALVVLVVPQAQKNVFLEDKVQVLQQQNEDLKARIDNNLSLSRYSSLINTVQTHSRTTE